MSSSFWSPVVSQNGFGHSLKRQRKIPSKRKMSDENSSRNAKDEFCSSKRCNTWSKRIILLQKHTRETIEQSCRSRPKKDHYPEQYVTVNDLLHLSATLQPPERHLVLPRSSQKNTSFPRRNEEEVIPDGLGSRELQDKGEQPIERDVLELDNHKCDGEANTLPQESLTSRDSGDRSINMLVTPFKFFRRRRRDIRR